MDLSNIREFVRRINALGADLERVRPGFRPEGAPELWIPNTHATEDDVMISCPFARNPKSYHKRLWDKKPGLGIEISPGGFSKWNCFVCHTRGIKMENFVDSLQRQFAIDPGMLSPLREFVDKVDGLTVEATMEMVKTPYEERVRKTPSKVFAESMLTEYKREVPQYAFDRGLSMETCQRWELGYDKPNQRLIMPVRDHQRNLVGIHGRAIHAGQEPKYFRYWDFDPSKNLYGVHLCEPGKPVLVVEGQFDAIHMDHTEVAQALGCGVVAVFGDHLSRTQADTLVKLFSECHLLFDNDHGGVIATEEAVDRLSERMPVTVLTYPTNGTGEDPGSMDAQTVISMYEQRMPAALWKVL